MSPPAEPVVKMLGELHEIPLREIPPVLAAAVARRILRTEQDNTELVEVATFGSCI